MIVSIDTIPLGDDIGTWKTINIRIGSFRVKFEFLMEDDDEY